MLFKGCQRPPPAPAERRQRPPHPTSCCPRPRPVSGQSARCVGAICGLDLQALSCPWRLVSESPDAHVSGGAIRCCRPAAWRLRAPLGAAEQQKLLAAGDAVAAAQAAASHARAGQTGREGQRPFAMLVSELRPEPRLMPAGRAQRSTGVAESAGGVPTVHLGAVA